MISKPVASRKLYDTFLFDGELDLLEHRLAETYDLVDWFVLVEAGQTFQGNRKPLTFAAHRARFASYAPKIRHLALPSLGSFTGDPSAAWGRERFQRNAVLIALSDLSPDDVVLLLDVDEVPARELLHRLREQGLNEPRRLAMTRHYQAVDLLGPASACCPPGNLPFPWAMGRKHAPSWSQPGIEWLSRSGVAVPGRALLGDEPSQRVQPHSLRRSAPLAGAIPNAGRHLCFVDPSAHPVRKLARVSHAELATERALCAEHLERCSRYGVHHRGWWYAERPASSLPDDLIRLSSRCADLSVGQRLPGALRRHVFRTWTWMRLLPAMPEAVVRAVDRSDTLLRLLTPALLAADLARAMARRVMRPVRSQNEHPHQ